MRDLHQGLKTEIIATSRAQQAGVEFVIVRHQWGKTDFEWSVHAFPNSFTTSGLQTTDLLKLVGFARNPCPFREGQECFAREISQTVDANTLAAAFEAAYPALDSAERSLQNCGFLLPQMEGWGYFFGSQGQGRRVRNSSGLGDGHTAAKTELLKSIEDTVFRFSLSWIVTASGTKAFITHYGFKNAPPSVELSSALKFLGLKTFDNCPQFDFSPCLWSGMPFVSEESPFNRSTDFAHGSFDAHPKHFSSGLEQLLRAHALLEPFGLRLLPIPGRVERQEQEFTLRTRAVRPDSRPVTRASTLPSVFDVAISFAYTERPFAEKLATLLKDAGYAVFYDDFYSEDLWGKDLVEFFHEIYSKRARYCVMFVSAEYAGRAYTIHERRSAQERMLNEKGSEYILPIKVDDTDLPGLPSTIGHLSLQIGIEKIAEKLIKKLGSP
jgi:hypothetical protein